MSTDSNRSRTVPAKPVILAGVALLTAFALLGGPVTFAFWNDQETQSPQVIDSASGLSLDATVTSTSYALGTLSSTVASSTTGLIPGTRGQRLTYSMTSGATDGVQGYISGTVAAAAKTAWASVYSAGYLTASIASSGTCTVNSTPTIVGGALTWSFSTAAGQTVKPGQTCTIVLDLSIPAVRNGVDVSRALLASRGTNTVMNPLADFTASAVLTQVPRAEEN